jgi:hypothetical protein
MTRAPYRSVMRAAGQRATPRPHDAGAVLGHPLASANAAAMLDGAGDGDLSAKDRSRAQAFPGPDAPLVGGAGREAGHGPMTFRCAIVRP